MSPIPVRRQERGEAAAHVTLLGCQADIAIPKEGAQQNKMQLNQLFKHLEDTLMNMKEENKELRKELDALKRQPKEEKVEVQINSKDVDTDNERITFIEKHLEERKINDQEALARVSNEITSMRNTFDEAISAQTSLSNSLREELANLSHKPLIASGATEVETVDGGEQMQDMVRALEQKVEMSISTMKSLVFSPLSVIFDAVRSEDWMGEDGILPYTKLNINLGEGMDMDSGKFTVPVDGVYFFVLNVYGAPRDAVVLSIRVNELQEVASCSGVGKASQSVVVDLVKDDTVSVFVNDKSKLMDTGSNKFTHFLGMLLRPDSIRF